MNDILVSIVLLTWNGEKYIEKCLESVINQTYKNLELIIIDNNSSNSDFKKYLEEQKMKDGRIKLFFNNSNLGFAKGMNIGIDKTIGKYILLLNQDVVLEENYLREAIKILEANPKIGGLSGIEKIWENGKILTESIRPNKGFFLKKRLQGLAINNFDTKEMFGLNGSFPIVRKKALDEIKKTTEEYYDEDFGTGWEDTDLWFRFHFLDWKLMFCPNLIAWHVGSGSADEETKLINKNLEYQKRIFRNRLYVIIKNIQGKLLAKLLLNLILAEILIPIYFLFVSPKSLMALFRAYKEVIKNFRKILEKRKKIKKIKKIEDINLFRFFLKF